MKSLKITVGVSAFALWAALLFAQTPVVPSSNPATGSQPYTTAWTSATAANTALTEPTAGFTAATVALNQTSTISGGGMTFEGSDTPDTTVTDNWYSVSCMAPTTNGSFYSMQQSTKIALQCNVIGFRRFRVRLSPQFTGSGTANVSISFSSLGQAPPASTPPTGSTTVTNLPTTVDTGNGATSASTPRVTLSNDSTGQVKATNFPSTVDVNTGAAGANTPRVVVSSDGAKVTNFPATVPVVSVANYPVSTTSTLANQNVIMTTAIPKFWQSSAPSVSSNASITFSAPGSGKSWVLDCLFAVLSAEQGATVTGTNFIQFTVSDGTPTTYVSQTVSVPSTASCGTTTVTPCVFHMQPLVCGLGIVAAQNQTLVVKYSAAVTNAFESVAAGAYQVQ